MADRLGAKVVFASWSNFIAAAAYDSVVVDRYDATAHSEAVDLSAIAVVAALVVVAAVVVLAAVVLVVAIVALAVVVALVVVVVPAASAAAQDLCLFPSRGLLSFSFYAESLPARWLLPVHLLLHP